MRTRYELIISNDPLIVASGDICVA